MKSEQEKMKKMTKRRTNNGITLIALVITIIVLLILAGVSIATLVGENGILRQAERARTETQLESDKEELEIVILGAYNIEDGTIDYEKVKSELLGWKLDLGVNEVTSPNGNTFNIDELLGKYNDKEIVYLNPDEWNYEIDESNNIAILLKYKGHDSELIIPNYIKTENGDVPIKIIGSDEIDPHNNYVDAWGGSIWDDSIRDGRDGYPYYPTFIKRVIVSDGIEAIRDWALASRGILYVKIPETVKYIGIAAFCECNFSGLKLPKGLFNFNVDSDKSTASSFSSSSGSSSYGSGSYGSGSYGSGSSSSGSGSSGSGGKIPGLVYSTSIRKQTFLRCKNLQSIEIPNGCTSIDESAFQDCGNLISIVIPKSVVSIENNAFSNCPRLEKVYYTGSLEEWRLIDINEKGNSILTENKVQPNYQQ